MRKAICLLAAFVLLATSVAATSSQVTNINLSHQNGYTSARIDVDGTVRFSHQTEVAKDGKPFRVIVDILKATHHLGAKKFMALPKCGVQAIRTSQYAAKPEAVVRVVFDMAQEASYRVESNQHSVTVVFPDKGGPKFADWSTSAVVAAMTKSAPRTVVATKDAAVPTAKTSQPAAPGKKSPAEVNSAIDKDRLASLASKDQPQSAKAKPSKPNAENPAPPKVTKPDDGTPFPSSTYTPGTGQFTDQDKWADLYKKPATPIKKTKSADQPTKSVKPPVSKPKPATAKAPKAEAPTKTASTTPAATGDKKVASKPKAESKQQVTKKVTKPPVKAQTKTVAKVDRPRDKSEGNVKPAAKSENTMKAAGKSDSKTVAKADKSKKPSGKTNKKTVAKADQA
ncbi:MAG: AMIN domain-containing protein, partial [candidate division Zixibacteria bacterium]|nr:AMIN domain-containing protein [candidate division Zixibacteria bacterium]